MVEPGAQLLAYERAQHQGFQELTVRVWWSATLWSAAMVSDYAQQLWFVTHRPMSISLFHPTSYIFMTVIATHLLLFVALVRTPKRINPGAAWIAASILALAVAGLLWIAVYETLAHRPSVIGMMDQVSSLAIFVIMPLGVWIAWMCSRGRLHQPGWLMPCRIALLLAFGVALWRVYFDSLNSWLFSYYSMSPSRVFANTWHWWIRQLGIAVTLVVTIFLGWVILRASSVRQYARFVSIAIVFAILAELYELSFQWIDFGNGKPSKAYIFRTGEILIMYFAPMFAALTWPRVIAVPSSADSHHE